MTGGRGSRALAGAFASCALALACTAGASTRFAAYEVVIDSGEHELAAWQVEIRNAAWRVVGVEGGAIPFEEPAYHDPKALATGRIVLAAFTLSPKLHAGKQRVAIVHVEESAELEPRERARANRALLVAAADESGRRIRATVRVRPVTEVP